MSARSPGARRARPGNTRERLVAAALEEFRRHGFGGTDTNKIARRAGFAPQTFYRWFEDKTAAFIAAYRSWEDEERRVIDALTARGASRARLVDAVVAHHRAYVTFRRSLRHLAVEDADVRRARAESRGRQVAKILEWTGARPARKAGIAVTLLQLERLADAAAEGEFDDLGVPRATARAAIARLLEQLR